LKAWKKSMNKIRQGIAAAALDAVSTDDSGTLHGRYRFPKDFVGFAGHFPGHPILPAIVEIMTVVALVGAASSCPQRLVAVEDAKFLSPVAPEQEILVRCRPRLHKGKLLHDAQLTVNGTTTASLLIELVADPERP
jgi:3-hydroxyacyl-[acyl-carrier-protein] dehydratase